MIVDKDPYVVLGFLAVIIPSLLSMLSAFLFRNAPIIVVKLIALVVFLFFFVVFLYFGLTYLGFFENPLFH